MPSDAPIDVLVVGAGPTGLSAAVEAKRHGLSVRVIDRKAHRSRFSKALVTHARTMEAFEAMGVSDAMRQAGVPFAALRVQPAPSHIVRMDLLGLDWGDTEYPYWLSIPQFDTERCLEEHLLSQGVQVEWNTSFESLDQDDSGVEVTLRNGGLPQTIRASWVVGCDGGRSPVRQCAGIGFRRKELGEVFVIIDVLGDTEFPQDEGTARPSRQGVLFLVPMPEDSRWRIIAHMPSHQGKEPISIDAAFVDHLIAERLGFGFHARDISWTSQFSLHQGIAESYRRGRVCIAGDAAHLHSPVGGQGLNMGVLDSFGLMWRLALIKRGVPSTASLMDSYEAERKQLGATMVERTTMATRVLTLRNPVVTTLRNLVARFILSLGNVQNKFGRAMGMLELSLNRGAVLVAGTKGPIRAGCRLPNPKTVGGRLYDNLHPTRHTLLLVDAPRTPALEALGVALLETHRLSNTLISCSKTLTRQLGGAKLVLVRPDRVIALTHPTADPKVIVRYASKVIGVVPSCL